MSDDTLEFTTVEYLKDTCGDRYGSMLGITACGESVGGIIFHHIYLGFGYTGPGCQRGHQCMQVRCLRY